jgi:hypothetical protein
MTRYPRVVVAALAALSALAVACAPTPTGTPQDQADQLIPFVERARSHDFVTTPTITLTAPTAFETAILANAAPREAEVATDDVLFTALDWISPAIDLVAEYRKVYSKGEVAFYDEAANTVRVKGTTAPTPFRREMIVRELTKALDDQVHDTTLPATGLLDEADLGARIAVHGSAEQVRNSYHLALAGADQLSAINEQATILNSSPVANIPDPLLYLTYAPAARGALLVQDLIDGFGKPTGPDLALAVYPDNTEQGYDTPKYLVDQGAAFVAVPPTEASAPVVDSGTFGAFSLSLMLKGGVVTTTLHPAVAGWEGGSYVTWTNGSSNCARIDTDMDSAAGATTLQTALNTWAGNHAGAVVELLSAEVVRVTRCEG